MKVKNRMNSGSNVVYSNFALRHVSNPLISIEDVTPYQHGFKVEGIFNCGVTRYSGEVILLCRVAESVQVENNNFVAIPTVTKNEGKDEIQVTVLEKKKVPQYNFSDSREITSGDGEFKKTVYLTSLSHLRIARSKDGIHFTVEPKPMIMPDCENESWGMEDPRITCIEGVYYISYTAVSPNGAATALITTKDFISFERRGLIFLPENKDIAVFPEKINGKYLAFTRPVPRAFGGYDIWLSKSVDMIHWGQHKHFYSGSASGWDDGRVGAGAPPFLTEKGWIEIYHAADRNNRYCLGAFLLDKENPNKILAKSKMPLLEPDVNYETEGFFPNVVFTCGCLYEKGVVKIYYGAADDKICRADITVEDLYTHLGV